MEKLKSLIEVRKLIALGITTMFIVLAFMGQIDGKLIEYVVVAVISYYFAKSTALDIPKSTNKLTDSNK